MRVMRGVMRERRFLNCCLCVLLDSSSARICIYQKRGLWLESMKKSNVWGRMSYKGVLFMYF